MHVKTIVHQILSGVIHKTRMKTLLIMLIGLIESKELKLSALGRALPIKGKERAGILRVNRFLSNPFYQNKSTEIYQCIIKKVIGNKRHPDILVDWSSIPNSHYTTEGGEHCLLRATYAVEGRAITLYEEVHAKKQESNPKVHREFLKRLKTLLPENCRPCIITDAGFKTPWFKDVIELGWDYIGRVACGTSDFDDGSGFQSVRTLFNRAKSTPQFLGTYILTKSNNLKTNFFIYKSKPKGRHKWTKTASKKIAKDKDSKKYGKSYREPWVLVSSLNEKNIARRVVNKYKSRMTIEENIRDTKSVHTGFSMNENITFKSKRYTVWLMLAALASLIAWIVGFAAEQQDFHYAFQANTYRHRRVLSFFYLGCQMIRKKIPITINLLEISELAWGH
jgi:Transposase DDE domain